MRYCHESTHDGQYGNASFCIPKSTWRCPSAHSGGNAQLYLAQISLKFHANHSNNYVIVAKYDDLQIELIDLVCTHQIRQEMWRSIDADHNEQNEADKAIHKHMLRMIKLLSSHPSIAGICWAQPYRGVEVRQNIVAQHGEATLRVQSHLDWRRQLHELPLRRHRRRLQATKEYQVWLRACLIQVSVLVLHVLSFNRKNGLAHTPLRYPLGDPPFPSVPPNC